MRERDFDGGLTNGFSALESGASDQSFLKFSTCYEYEVALGMLEMPELKAHVCAELNPIMAHDGVLLPNKFKILSLVALKVKRRQNLDFLAEKCGKTAGKMKKLFYFHPLSKIS